MALHPQFPTSPYEPLSPALRWFPAEEALRETAYEKLLPPLVARIRVEVEKWRNDRYRGASETSISLLNWWFNEEHWLEGADGSLDSFQYYFSQREAVETVIWLYDVKGARDKFDLLRFDASGSVSPSMFPEEWTRYVIKMATGAGKTKVLSLLIAWSYYHKLYEVASDLSRNFLVIAPNIIVLDRLRADFDGLRIFFHDPVLPINGFDGRNWVDDFQMSLHIQDDVRLIRPMGNIFLTNIHRVFLGDVAEPSLEDEDLRDYFLTDAFGAQPVGKTNDSATDLGEIVRDIEELAVFNDEAHHIHNPKMAWFKSIQDIHHQLLQRDRRLSIQIDVTATPRHDNGSIFVQTVSDYPLVEAIHQNVVKHPVLPDLDSRGKLREHKSSLFNERYADYLTLGIEEWRKSFEEQKMLGKKAVLFVMVDDTRNCDDVGAHLERICPELQGAVLVIHTKSNGEISEASSSKNKEELEKLRKQSNEIDSWDSPYKAIVSVLMLKEGWDVRNVTTIVGLRAYSSKANILPEQTLGRGLRRMHFGTDLRETVSVMGTPAFMEFVESIQLEGVSFEYAPMGDDAQRKGLITIEVDGDNPNKDLKLLDIQIPKLSRRFHREFRDLEAIDPGTLGNRRLPLRQYDEEDIREIVFKTMLEGEVHHTVVLDGSSNVDYRSVVAFYARQLIHDLRLVGGYEVLYPKVRDFIKRDLFEGPPVDLDDLTVLRNLSESSVSKVLYDTFVNAINAHTINEIGTIEHTGTIQLSEMRPFRVESRPFLEAQKCIYTKVVGEARSGGFELEFAAFLESASDVSAFSKNYLAIGFRLDYVRADGSLSYYVPDFIVRDVNGIIWIIETKGREELDLPQKMKRLKQWCFDATVADTSGCKYAFLYVDQSSFEKHHPATMHDLVVSFKEFQS